MTPRQTSTRGFKRTANVLNDQIRRVGESRGFAVSRVLTHWAEIAGTDIAAIARPVNISYGRGGFGATLTVLTTGAQAPMLEMQKEKLRERVNSAYGYNAISRIRITQTAPTGFAEGQAQFAPSPKKAMAEPPAKVVEEVKQTVTQVENDELRAALERLGRNVLSNSKS
ncbi:DUF721 domain-containing protein [Arenibacterium sp. CAU 1754]